MELLNQNQLAKRLGLSKGRISQLVSEGRLNSSKVTDPTNNKVLFDLDKVLKALSKDQSNIENALKEVSLESEEELNESATYDQVRTKKMLFTAELERLEYEKTKGLLVPIEQVEKEAFECARRVRESFASIPDRLAAELAATSSEFQVHKILTLEINQALEGLSNK
jgi:phage terminase Nu1 subunit (DNA packaging protein)